MNIMTPTAVTSGVDIGEIADTTAASCLATRVRQLSRIVTRVYDDALRPLGITASQFTLLTQLAQQDGITAVEIGHSLAKGVSDNPDSLWGVAWRVGDASQAQVRLSAAGFNTSDAAKGRRPGSQVMTVRSNTGGLQTIFLSAVPKGEMAA